MTNTKHLVALGQNNSGAPLIWHTAQRVVDDLIPQTINPRVISGKQLEDLKKNIEKMNLVEIPAVDLDGKIIAGHQRVKVLKLLGRGKETIDVRVPNRKLSDDEVKRYLIASNALGGDWDFDLLKDFDIDLLTDIGFDQNDLANIWDNNVGIKDEEFNIDKELEKIKIPTTKLGDIIELGDHRLICGDACDLNVIKRLFGDKRASMIYSDPVYNIGLS